MAIVEIATTMPITTDMTSTVLVLRAVSTPMQVTTELLSTTKSTAKISTTIPIVTALDSRAYRTMPELETSKLSEYSITPQITDHTAYAASNIITQFKGCDNLIDLIRSTLLELDVASQDVRDFQEVLYSIEDAYGIHLDRLGTLIGRNRNVSESDSAYRYSLYAQVYCNICDATIPSILKALLVQYNMVLGPASKDEIRIQTGSRSTLNVHFRDEQYLDNYGGVEYIEKLVSAGSQVFVTVSDGTIGGDFVTEGDEDGWGLGSLYEEDDEQGRLVSVYGADSINFTGVKEGDPLPTTNKTIPVPTFE